jgi:5'(3')-deoxyribonucleotidase
MRIAIDFDDTVADSNSVLLALMNWKLGTTTKFEDLEWDFFHRNNRVEKAFWGLHDLYDSTYLRRAMPPVDPYAFAVIKELRRTGHDIHIVTRNNPKGVESIRSWLFMHGVDVPVMAIGRGGGGAKAKLPFDLFIDDNPHLVSAMGKYPDKRLILYARPWNRFYHLVGGRSGRLFRRVSPRVMRNVRRVDTWLRVREVVQELERRRSWPK